MKNLLTKQKKAGQSNIHDVIISPLNIIDNDNGPILHMMRSNSSIFENFGESYFSELFPNKVKAWKYHKTQTQNLSIPVGYVRLVIYDNRVSSPTKNNVMIIDSGRENNYSLIKIPKNLWYGFKNLSKYKSIISNITDIPHDKEESISLEYETVLIPYKW